MANSDEARQLLAASERDWIALQGVTNAEVFADEIYGFHAQQCVEKALKAWLSCLGVEYPKSHDLSLLLTQLRVNGQNVDRFNELIEFNPYAVQFRYEAFEELGSPLDRDAVRNQVSDFFTHVRRFIDGLS